MVNGFWNKYSEFRISDEYLETAKTSTQVRKVVQHLGEGKAHKMILDNAMAHRDNFGYVDIPYNTKLYLARQL